MQQAVEIESRGLTLRGMLHRPEGSPINAPMVLIFHGYTGNKMEPHFIFVKLSRLLEKNGIASVRFDFGGSGESDGDFVDMTLSNELEDAKAVLSFVKTLDFVNPEQIGIVGLSMGGVVASMLAGDCREDIGALCLWAPAGNMKDIPLAGKSEGEITEFYKKGFIDVGGLAVGVGFVEELSKFDFLKKAARYDKRVLLLHGSKDTTVPLNVSQQFIKIYGARVTFHTIDGGDHTFNNLAWEKKVLDYSVQFFNDEIKNQ
jgi:uncharacterized protein